MNVRNLLHPGESVCPIPMGFRATLQYGSNGKIEHILDGFTTSGTYWNQEEFDSAISRHLFPLQITITGGTTWIYGVFYTDARVYDFGKLSDVGQTAYRELFFSGEDVSSPFKFYGINAESMSSYFSGPMAVNKWLASLSDIIAVPSFIYMLNTDDDKLFNLFNSNPITSKFVPKISGLLCCQNNQYRLEDTPFIQGQVANIERDIASDGQLWGTIYFYNTDDILYDVEYSTIYANKVSSDDLIIYDAISSKLIDKFPKVETATTSLEPIFCTICGKRLRYTPGSMICDDENCGSRMYDRVYQFLEVLGLPLITFDKYKEIIKEFPIVNISDVLDFSPYTTTEVKTTLRELLRAIIPIEIVRNNETLTILCNKCNNKAETLEYYLSNPIRIRSDLDINNNDIHQLILWLSNDVGRLLDIKTMFHHERIHISNIERRFDGPNLFRGKQICITGTFIHGDNDTVANILRSYGAVVTTTWSIDVSCVIVGDCNEFTNGQIVRAAKETNIPVFTESQFFTKYEIDADLASNL